MAPVYLGEDPMSNDDQRYVKVGFSGFSAGATLGGHP